MGRYLSLLLQILILAFNAHFQVSDLTEAAIIPLPFIILCPGCNGARQHGESWSMRTRNTLDSDVELGQSQREIRSSEGSYPVDTELRTPAIEVDKLIAKDSGHPRLKGHRGFRSQDTKINTTSSYKLLRERRALNSSTSTETLTDKSLQNPSFIDIPKVRKNLSTVSEQMRKSKVNNDFNIAANSSSSSVKKLHRRSQQTFLAWSNTFGRREWNPCVKQIIKIYHSKLQRVLTKVKCHRASFYCSPVAGGLGRCMPLKTFYASISKVLTTGCKCR